MACLFASAELLKRNGLEGGGLEGGRGHLPLGLGRLGHCSGEEPPLLGAESVGGAFPPLKCRWEKAGCGGLGEICG